MPINHFRHAVPALLLSAMAAGSVCGAGAAEPYPSRNIRIVIPGGPGTPGPLDRHRGVRKVLYQCHQARPENHACIKSTGPTQRAGPDTGESRAIEFPDLTILRY